MSSNLLEPILIEARQGFLAFAVGYGVWFFGVVATGAALAGNATCSAAIYVALFSGLLVGAALCITACIVSAVSGSISAGLYTYGSSVGWTFETSGAAVGERSVYYAPVIHNRLGISHNYDADVHRQLNQTYGAMLDSHNTTIVAVTWMETLPTFNHTGKLFDGLNMTLGRHVSLNDNGMIRTALGQTSQLGSILVAFDDFKTGKNASASGKKTKRDLNVDWLSFNTYGENMNEANGYLGDVRDVEIITVDDGILGYNDDFETDWAQAGSGQYASKLCVAVGPENTAPGQYSMIVGEVYMNAWGVIDTMCTGG